MIRNIDGTAVTLPLDRDRITLGRSPAEKELAGDLAFLSKEREMKLGPGSDSAAVDSAHLSALTQLAHVMLNTNEFVYID